MLTEHATSNASAPPFRGTRGPGKPASADPYAHKFRCLACGGQRLKCINSRQDPAGGRSRRYECLDCRDRLSTVEILAPLQSARITATDQLHRHLLTHMSLDAILDELRRRVTQGETP